MKDQTTHKQIPSLEWTVAEVLSRCPAAAGAFTRLRMACPGCDMAPFETLGEAAAAYKLDPKNVLREICRSIRKQNEL